MPHARPRSVTLPEHTRQGSEDAAGHEVSKLRRPCTNCPWRVDAPRGYWDPQHFIDIWQSCQDDGTHIMLCHKSNALPKEQLGSVPCQGWIRVMGFRAIGVRLLSMQQRITHAEIEDDAGLQLFRSFTAMLRANKVPLPTRSRVFQVTADDEAFSEPCTVRKGRLTMEAGARRRLVLRIEVLRTLTSVSTAASRGRPCHTHHSCDGLPCKSQETCP